MIVGLALAWVGLIITGWLGWQLLRQNGRILLRLDELEKRLNELKSGADAEPEGLPLGSEAPAVELPNLAGERKSLAQFRGQSVLLIFFSPDCGFCREMMPKLAALGTDSEVKNQKSEAVKANATSALSREQRPAPLIITTGDVERNRQFFAGHRVSCPVLLQKDGKVAKAYQVQGTPGGYLISPEGKITSKLAMGAEALLALTNGGPHPQPLSHPMGEGGQGQCEGDRANRFANRSLANSKINRAGLEAGTAAPDFRLPRLDGCGDLALSELRGKRVLLVFSSPHCGPCEALVPDLETFHRQQPEIELLMISKGESKENREKVKEHGLTFPIVLQQQWEISRRYAMFATPIAYLIDEEGLIAENVAVGTEAIVDLMARAGQQQVPTLLPA